MRVADVSFPLRYNDRIRIDELPLSTGSGCSLDLAEQSASAELLSARQAHRLLVGLC